MNRRFLSCVLAVLVVTPLLSSCGGEGENGTEFNTPASVNCGQGSGTLRGRVLAPNGKTPIVGATLRTTGFACTTTTDGEGRFAMDGVPEGDVPVEAKKGVFTIETTVTSGSAATLKVDPTKFKLAHFVGAFDRIEEVAVALGFSSTQLTSEADLLAESFGSTYQVLLLNCGMFDTMDQKPEVRAAIKAFAENGGAVYISDWSERFVQQVFPDHITFRDPAKVGAKTSDPVTVTVLDPGLAAALGRDTAQIRFDTLHWAMIDAVAENVDVLVRGEVADEQGETKDRPLAVRFSVGEGRVTYTSFHNEFRATEDTLLLIEQMLFGL